MIGTTIESLKHDLHKLGFVWIFGPVELNDYGSFFEISTLNGTPKLETWFKQLTLGISASRIVDVYKQNWNFDWQKLDLETKTTDVT